MRYASPITVKYLQRTMEPGLSMTMNWRSLSWSTILTGVDVTAGSWRWDTFLHQGHVYQSDDFTEQHSLDSVSVSNDGVWLCDLAVDGGHPGLKSIPLELQEVVN